MSSVFTVGLHPSNTKKMFHFLIHFFMKVLVDRIVQQHKSMAYNPLRETIEEFFPLVFLALNFQVPTGGSSCLSQHTPLEVNSLSSSKLQLMSKSATSSVVSKTIDMLELARFWIFLF